MALATPDWRLCRTVIFRQNRPLDEVYPILYIDAIHYSVRDNGVIRKLAAYVILGINTEGKKEVLTITIGDNESAKYWLSVLNELKNRGVKDILIICADGLTGIKKAIAAAFPKKDTWDAVSPIFKFSTTVRKVIYTTYTDKKTMPIFHEIPVNKGLSAKNIGIVFITYKAALIQIPSSIAFLLIQMGWSFQ